MLTPETREKMLDALHGGLAAVVPPDELAAEWLGLLISGLAAEFEKDGNEALRALNTRLARTQAGFRIVHIADSKVPAS